jgi:lysophospholipase L1-like esterase
MMINSILRLFVTATLTLNGVYIQAKERWLFLGDSITQAGHYVDFVETWMLLNEADAPEIISLGLSSETISGLSEQDHPFPRPYLHSRLDAILERVQPDVVIACYGMNCAIYHPFSEDRFEAYQDGINKLIDKTHAIGADIILLTPPPFAGRVKPKTPPPPGEPYGYKYPTSDYNEVLASYGEWILSLNGEKGVRAFTIRPGLERFMAKSYPKEPIHPSKFGHELMAEAFLQALGKSTNSDLLESGISSRSADVRWIALLALVNQQRTSYDYALLNDIGHGNPSVMKKFNTSLSDAEELASSIEAEMEMILKN